MKLCGLHFPRNDIKDVTGCLREQHHDDEHVCKTREGHSVTWHFDYECDCGCWDDLEHEWDCGCVVYHYLD